MPHGINNYLFNGRAPLTHSLRAGQGRLNSAPYTRSLFINNYYGNNNSGFGYDSCCGHDNCGGGGSNWTTWLAAAGTALTGLATIATSFWGGGGSSKTDDTATPKPDQNLANIKELAGKDFTVIKNEDGTYTVKHKTDKGDGSYVTGNYDTVRDFVLNYQTPTPVASPSPSTTTTVTGNPSPDATATVTDNEGGVSSVPSSSETPGAGGSGRTGRRGMDGWYRATSDKQGSVKGITLNTLEGKGIYAAKHVAEQVLSTKLGNVISPNNREALIREIISHNPSIFKEDGSIVEGLNEDTLAAKLDVPTKEWIEDTYDITVNGPNPDGTNNVVPQEGAVKAKKPTKNASYYPNNAAKMLGNGHQAVEFGNGNVIYKGPSFNKNSDADAIFVIGGVEYKVGWDGHESDYGSLKIEDCLKKGTLNDVKGLIGKKFKAKGHPLDGKTIQESNGKIGIVWGGNFISLDDIMNKTQKLTKDSKSVN